MSRSSSATRSWAGERALAAHAYEEALGHFERARDASAADASDVDTAAVLYGLARAELGARELFNVGHALELLCQAFDLYVAAGDTQKAVEVVAQPLPPVFEATGISERIARALSMVDEGSLEHAGLLVSAGWFAGTHGLTSSVRARRSSSRLPSLGSLATQHSREERCSAPPRSTTGTSTLAGVLGERTQSG